MRDIIQENLKILFIGYNPGLRSEETGHHYAGYSNRFWKLLFDSGLIPVPLRPEDDERMLEYGMGSINLVDRATRKADEIAREEFDRGRIILVEKIKRYKPRILCFEGIGVYKAYTGRKNVKCGLQSSPFTRGIRIIEFVNWSPSGLNRVPYADQLRWYMELKKLADNL